MWLSSPTQKLPLRYTLHATQDAVFRIGTLFPVSLSRVFLLIAARCRIRRLEVAPQRRQALRIDWC